MIKTIDTVILGLLLFLVIKGIWRGFKKELLTLLTYGTAFLVATSQTDNGARFFERTLNLHPLLGYFVAYSAVFLVVYLVVKFFTKTILKLINRVPASGLIDSIGGGILGFCLGMIVVGMFTTMIKPIPVVNQILAQSHRSIFLPFSEKYAEPIVTKFMSNPVDKIPLTDLLSKGTGENLILPDVMKGLLGTSGGGLQGISDMLAPALKDAQKTLQDAGGESGGSVLPAPPVESLDPASKTYQQALKLLNADTSAIDARTMKDLLKIIK